jgi:hypothetical protein
MCGVTSFANVWKHTQCCSDIHTFHQRCAVGFSVVDVENGDTFAG